MPADPSKLRELASWYREFADRAGNPTIWLSRLRTAEDLELQADLLDHTCTPEWQTQGQRDG